MFDEPLKIILDTDYSLAVFKELLIHADFNRRTNIELKMSPLGIGGYAYLFKEGVNNFIGWSGDYNNDFIHSSGYYEAKHSYKIYDSKEFLKHIGVLKDKNAPWTPMHKEPIWCWDDIDGASRELRFWDNKSNRPYGKSRDQLNTIRFKYYAQVEYIESWMILMQKELPN